MNGGPGFVSRLVERWQFGVIYNQFAGSPLNISSGVSSFNQFTDNTPVPVGNFPSTIGKVKKVDNGVVFFDGLKQAADPSAAKLTTLQGLNARNTLFAVTDASGQLLLVNPSPGQLGSLGQLYLRGPGSFRLDVNLVKRFKIREDWNFEFRADAIGLSNTPQFDTFNTDINSTNFGRITGAGGTRLFVLGLRLNF